MIANERVCPPTVRICLLTTQDLDHLPLPGGDWPCDPRPFLPEATWQVAVIEKKLGGGIRLGSPG